MPVIKVKQLLNIAGTINALMGAKVEVHTAFKLRKFIAEAVTELQAIDEARQNLVKKYGEILPNSGGQFRVKDEHAEEFSKEWEKLVSEDVVLPNIVIRVSSLEKASLTMGDIANLDFILDQEDTGEASPLVLLDGKKPS